MTPAERRQLEAAYDRFYTLYDEGKLRPAELDEMHRIYDQLGPTWEAEAAKAAKASERRTPTIQAREPSVGEEVSDWLARNVYQPMGLSERSSYGEGRKLSFLLELLPGPGTVMAGAQVPRDVRAGNYGMAALNAATVPLDLLGVGPVRRGMLAAADPAIDPVQQAFRRRSLPDYAYLTHEAQPYPAVGRNVLEGDVGVDNSPFLPGATAMTPEERALFAADPRRSWVDPETGGDILSQAVGARTLPTLRGQGVYDGPDGLEFNPLSIGRSYATPEQLWATESLRGLLDVQGATPWTRLAAGDLPAVFLPKTRQGTVEEMTRLKEVGEPYGLSDIVDVGEGYILTNYMGGAADVGREARRALEKASGLKAIRSTAESGYPGYEGAWERGAGQAIRRYLENIQSGDEEALAALEASDAVKQAARDRAMLAREAGATLGGSNRVVEEMMRTIGRGEGFSDRLQSYAERLEARRIEPQIPLFSAGTQPSGTATHFSSVEGLPELDPLKYGTNPKMKGAELALPVPYPPQTYFGIDAGKPGGYIKEGALGDIRYDVPEMPSNLLDLAAGWGDISDEAAAIVARMEANAGQPMTPAAREAALEAYRMRIAKMRGYGGLYNPNAPSGPIVTSFYPVATGAQ